MNTGKIDVTGILNRIREQAVREFAEVMKENLQNIAKEEIMGREYYLSRCDFFVFNCKKLYKP